MENNRAYIKHAILAAKKAGKLLIELTPTIPLSAIERKKLMDEADRKVHDSIYETLRKAFPNQRFPFFLKINHLLQTVLYGLLTPSLV
jgi:3'-phosphoadenosine 5'-phosphosulfate (PAPS) 3'-phosphatase